jgi:O-antigen ligase
MISPLLYIEESATGVNFSRFYYAGDMVLYAMIPVTLASLAMLKPGSQAWRFGLLALLLYWVFRTYFRQYWLTLFVISMLLVVFLSGKERMRLLKRSLPAAIAGVMILSVLMTVQPAQFARAIQPLTSRLASLGQDPLREGSLQWRVIETNYALEQIVRHPVFGIGLGKPYRPPMITESGTNTYTGWASTYIENGYLYILVTMGLVGLLPFLWLCGVYLFRVFRHQHEIQDDGLRAIYIGFGLAFLGMMACNITTPTFVIGSRSIFFPVSMAINEIILRLEREKRARP